MIPSESSKRSRDSVHLLPNQACSMGATPRPTPKSSRPPRELVGDAHVLEDPHGMVEWKELHHRSEAYALGHLRRRADEQLLIGRQTEVGTVVLGEVEGREPRLVGHADELEPILEQAIRRGAGDALDVVENAESRRHQTVLSVSVADERRP
jgi:hypothetical protein